MLLAALACLTATNTYAKKNSEPTPEEKGLALINRESAEAFIGFLASDELKGREAGTEEDRIAGNYIASLLQQWGVSPLFDSYFQPFEAYRVERQKKGRLQVHPDSIQLIKQGVHQKYNMRNVLAKIEGKNKTNLSSSVHIMITSDTTRCWTATRFTTAPMTMLPEFLPYCKLYVLSLHQDSNRNVP